MLDNARNAKNGFLSLFFYILSVQIFPWDYVDKLNQK